jgi:crotonobetainyl-CoA:carnitine CoA-transferase CaiB-like acyl-CoA transferase
MPDPGESIPFGPLRGVRVLEFSLIFSAPYAGVQLADLGAEVIKVEPPGGEPFRQVGTPVPGHSKTFQWANRGKQSLIVDLRHPEGLEVIHRLLARIDVVLINYRPGVASRLGLDYDSLARHKSDLIYAEINGFGEEGPLADRAASDIVAQAYGGAVALDGKVDEHGAPAWPALPVADLPGGLATAMGICAALYHRERTGEGQRLSIPLLRAVMQMGYIHLMVEPVNDAALRDFARAEIERVRAAGGSYAEMIAAREGVGQRGSPISLYFSGYRARDGGLVLGAITEENRRSARAVLGIEDDRSDDPGYDGTDPANHRQVEALRDRIRSLIRERDVDEWMQLFSKAGVPAAPVLLPEDVPEHPQASLHMVELEHEITGPQKQVKPLVDLSASPSAARSAAPIAGQQSERVLAEVGGYSAAEIAALRERGTVS